jgi:hypothetical protein
MFEIEDHQGERPREVPKLFVEAGQECATIECASQFIRRPQPFQFCLQLPAASDVDHHPRDARRHATLVRGYRSNPSLESMSSRRTIVRIAIQLFGRQRVLVDERLAGVEHLPDVGEELVGELPWQRLVHRAADEVLEAVVSSALAASEGGEIAAVVIEHEHRVDERARDGVEKTQP